MPRNSGRAGVRSRVEEAFRLAVERHGMIRGGDRVLAAVSGGGDSVLMLHLLMGHRARRPFTLHVAHLNHALRGAESDQDEAFTRDLAARHSLPFTGGRADLARRPGDPSSLEERARIARRAFLREAASGAGCNRIALGHTLDDQAETILMWLLRGTGRGGLAGMEPVTREGLIRPLIGIRRLEAREYLGLIGEPYRDDATNDDAARLRSRIRRRLVPLIEAEFGGAVETIAVEASALAEEETFLDEAARALLEAPPGGLSASNAASAPPALRRRAVRLAAEAAGLEARSLNRDHIEEIAGLLLGAAEGRGVDLPGGYRAERRGDAVLFVRGPEQGEGGKR